MKNHFSESSHLLTNDFIGLIIWMAAFIPLVLVPPEKLQIPFAISFVLFGSSCIGILIWWVHMCHVSALPLSDQSQGRTPCWWPR